MIVIFDLDASCRDWFRRKPLIGAFTHPSKMVYPPGDFDNEFESHRPREYIAPEPTYPRPDLEYDVDGFKSESQ